MKANVRRRHERRGRGAELIAALWLAGKGYRILGRRVRTPFGELDLVALKRGLAVVVEVKARPSLAAGLEAVGPWQQQRIERAALSALASFGLAGRRLRFDLIVVTPPGWPRHVRDAWRPDLMARGGGDR